MPRYKLRTEKRGEWLEISNGEEWTGFIYMNQRMEGSPIQTRTIEKLQEGRGVFNGALLQTVYARLVEPSSSLISEFETEPYFVKYFFEPVEKARTVPPSHQEMTLPKSEEDDAVSEIIDEEETLSRDIDDETALSWILENGVTGKWLYYDDLTPDSLDAIIERLERTYDQKALRGLDYRTITIRMASIGEIPVMGFVAVEKHFWHKLFTTRPVLELWMPYL